MSSAKTWLKIIFVLIALGMLGMCAVAGAGIYFVTQHVSTSTVSSSSALQQFEEARARFEGQTPLIEIDSTERVRRMRDIGAMPTADTRTKSLGVMVWNPEEERIVNLKLPLWILTMGQKKVELGMGPDSFDLRRLELDLKELERVGPLLIVDIHTVTGERILVWTE